MRSQPLPCAVEHWAEFSALLDLALELPQAAREAWLQGLAPASAHLRPALRRVLILAQQADLPRLDTPMCQPALGANEPELSEFRAGQTLGPWRLLEPLGQGGMGEVWLAERCDSAYQRQVALKLPHALALAGQGRQRFARERDILAALQHPHIAQFFDAGCDPLLAPDGAPLDAASQPWLALEHVAGRPLTEHARAQGLSLRERLQLMLQVMAAVQYAHGLLLVHRDLKPSNLLVSHTGQVKLLDFGIAKLLGPQQAGEPTRLLLATPAYAAPEQWAGGPVSVATDVYALGVLLQELLCGSPPARGESRLASQLLPARPAGSAHAASLGLSPRRLQRLLRGDLDALLAQAQAPVPSQRYANVQALMDDVQRYLDGRPLRARRIGAWARWGKSLRRHWLFWGAAGALAVSLGLGLAATLWQARQAAHQAQRAETIKSYLLDLFKTLDPRQAGAQDPASAMRRLLQQQMAQIEQRLPDDPEMAEDLLRLSATVALYLSDEARSLELAQLRWRLLKQRLGPVHERSTEAGLSLFWALWSADQGQAASGVLRELDRQLPAAGLLRAEWTLARHDVMAATGASPAERQAVLQQALQRYAEVAPQDSGHIAALAHWAALQLQSQQWSAALDTLERALALLTQARPYIALDHARVLGLRAQVWAARQQAGRQRDDLDQAVGLLRGSVGLRNPLAWAIVAQRLELACAEPAHSLQARALWQEAWPSASADGRVELLRAAVAPCAWSQAEPALAPLRR